MKPRDTSLPQALDRRQFLRGGLTLGAGLVVGFHWQPRRLEAAAAAGAPFAPNAFVRIAPDNTVTVISKHIEFGQGTYTGLATILAEELDASWDQVRVESSPVGPAYVNLAFGAMATGGSTAMANSWMQLRQAGATARATLVAAAAGEWAIDAADIEVSSGVVHHIASGRSATFGELAEQAATLTPPTEAPLKEPKQFKLIGRTLPRVDMQVKSTGKAKFTIDLELPGMLTAVIARPPRFGATVASFDDRAAREVPGVVQVVQVPAGIAVLSEGFWPARQGREALEIEWDSSRAETRGSEELLAEYREIVTQPGLPANRVGDAEQALAAAHRVVEADYEFPYLAHAPMETLDCVVRLGADACEVWAGSQLQQVDQAVIAAHVGLPPEKVQIHTMLAGGSFGRRATPNGDVAGEAASIAKAIDGRAPIKLIWTREDDIRGGRYRPLYFHRLRAGLDADGKLIAWHHHIVGQSILKGTPFEPFLVKNGIDNTSVEGARNLPYKIPGFLVELTTTEVEVPVLWWRSVGHTHNGYSTETFIDEMAHAAGRDPLDFRRAMMAEHPRHRAVLELAAAKAGWGTPLPEGKARGFALQESFGSFVAQVVEVSVGPDGLPRVERVVCAVDCGIALNPDVIRAQMESGIGFGLGAALFNEVELEGGRVMPSNFHDYRPLRIQEMPEVEVFIVPSAENPTGVGEVAVPPIAPAVANAWFQLTGQRVRRLPFQRVLA